MEAGQGPERAADLDRVLRTLAEGLRVVAVLLAPWIPGAAEKLLAALGAPDLSLAGARFGAGDDRRGVGARAAVPQAAGRRRAAVIDSHTHLDSCGPPNAELVAAAAREGVARILTVGMDAATNRTALQAAEAFPQVHAAVGRHPNHAAGFDDADLAELAGAGRPPALRARSARPAWTTTATTRRAPTRSAPSTPRSSSPATTGKPLVIHTRAAEDDTVATLERARAGPAGDPALLLDARPPRGVPRPRAGGSRSPATSPTRRRPTSPTPRSACPTTACSSRPTRPT